MDSTLFEKVRLCMKGRVKESRYEHSMRTAEMTKELCLRYGVDADKGLFAGMAHDICKDLSDEDMIATASRDGLPVTELEKSNPFLLHGRAAAVFLREEFSVGDSEILEAVANHTLGLEGSCPLARLLFAADKIEPGRPQSTDDYRANLMKKGMNEMVLAVVQENSEYLTSRGKKVADQSLRFEAFLKEEIKKSGGEA